MGPVLAAEYARPAMALLFLIRHGATDQTGRRLYGRTPGVHLSELGRQQAAALAERFAPVRLDAIVSSPLERCRETAAQLADSQELRVSTRADLLEVDYGGWTNRPLAQLARTKLWRVVQGVPSQARFPGGESLMEVQARVSKAALSIAVSRHTGLVAVVTHGDVIRLLVSHLLGTHIDQFQRIAIDAASVSVVALGQEHAPRVLRVNDVGSLEAFAPRKRPRPGVGG